VKDVLRGNSVNIAKGLYQLLRVGSFRLVFQRQVMQDFIRVHPRLEVALAIGELGVALAFCDAVEVGYGRVGLRRDVGYASRSGHDVAAKQRTAKLGTAEKQAGQDRKSLAHAIVDSADTV
jgi:hypothetical protein